MKPRILKTIIAILLLLSMTIVANASVELLNNTFDVGETIGKQPTEKTIPGLGTVFTVIPGGNSNNKIIVSDENPENLCLLSKIEPKDGGATSPSNTLYFLINNEFLNVTKNFFVMSMDVKLDSQNKFLMEMKAGNNWGQGVVLGGMHGPYGADNTIRPSYLGGWSENTNHIVPLTPGEFFNLKIIFDLQQGKTNFYINGKQYASNSLRKDFPANVGTWGTLGAKYFTITHNMGNAVATAENPAKMYLDNIKIYTLQDNDLEMVEPVDVFSNAESTKTYIVDRQVPQSDASLGYNIINRTAEPKPFTFMVANYEETADGYKILKGYNYKNYQLQPGLNNIETPIFNNPISENENKRYSKIFMWNTLDQMLPYQSATLYENKI